MRHINTKASALRHHLSHYSIIDAKLDNPHRPARELPAIVRAARSEYRPLRQRLHSQPR